MKFFGLSVLSILFSLNAFSSSRILTTQIREVDVGSKMGDEVLVFLTSGDVARLKYWDSKLLGTLQGSEGTENYFRITLDDRRRIKAIKKTPSPVGPKVTNFAKILFEENYTPTTIPSMEIAKSYISESRHPTKPETQCFNRAMVWSYEWWRKHSLKTNKIFVFWPKEYVRKHSFKWWFHVSPYAHIMDTDGIVKQRVLDVKWLKRPYEFQEWANYHSSHDVPCRTVNSYSEYADFPFDTDRCYFIKTNMYTWMPADIEMKEGWDFKKSGFFMNEVEAAYLEAFDIKL
ncbi:MAG TPA: protein-glutamine glutaminase family protein [Bacteriovoracaceae bacterium]|nr:protein-glutamine glutaminase family protein [Bacteriovoracaceae bacterium]